MVQDPGGLGQKIWAFDTNSADASVGLATSYVARVAYGTNTGGQQLDYAWTTNSSGNLYNWATFKTQDVALASALASYTTQTQDQYGNVTQVGVSNQYVSWSQQASVRTYTNTYMNTSNYTNLHIVNRLTGSSVTDGNYTTALSSITYDGGVNGSLLKDAPGITAHDSAYGCPSPSGGYCFYPPLSYRGNPTIITQPGKAATMTYDIAGNAAFILLRGPAEM